MASSSYKLIEQKVTVEECLEFFYGDLEGLEEECREIVDNSPESLRSTDRISTFESTADALATIAGDQLELASELVEFFKEPLTVMLQANRRKGKGPSRSVRCANACAFGDAAASEIERWCDEQPEEIENKLVDKARELVDGLRDQLSEAEGAEFPSMFG